MEAQKRRTERNTVSYRTANVEDWHTATTPWLMSYGPSERAEKKALINLRRDSIAPNIFRVLWCSPGIPSGGATVPLEGFMPATRYAAMDTVFYPTRGTAAPLRRPNKFLFVNVAADRLDKCARKYGAPWVLLAGGSFSSFLSSFCIV